MLAVVGKRLLVKRLENDLHLLFKQLAIGRLIEQRRAKSFHFSGVIATANAEGDASTAENVRRGKIFRQAQGMPHRGNVEATAKAQSFGHMSQMQGEHQDVWNALVAFVLEVMLSRPEGMVAQPIHDLRHGLGFVKDGDEMFVGKAPLIHGRTGVADVVHVDMTSKETIEFGNHAFSPSRDCLAGFATLHSHTSALSHVA